MMRKASFVWPAAVTCALLFSSCISRGITVVPFLKPTATATVQELVEHVQRWGEFESLALRVELQFETVVEAEKGKGRRYHTANGRLLLERPSSIRLNIQAPVLSADIAEMASDGSRFQLLIHPPDYRALILGSNRKIYQEEVEKLGADPELRRAGPLLNIRPQHFTAAFLPPVIDEETLTFMHEELVVEPDPRPQARKDAQVRKSYYVLNVVERGAGAPRAQFWFDRVSAVTLARQRVFDAEGLLVTDVQYLSWLPPEAAEGLPLPAQVRIERPYDDYALSVSVRPDGIVVDRELPDSAFLLEVPAEWGESLRRIDLDDRQSR